MQKAYPFQTVSGNILMLAALPLVSGIILMLAAAFADAPGIKMLPDTAMTRVRYQKYRGTFLKYRGTKNLLNCGDDETN